MPLIAFAPDIKGVCRVLGIFEINSNPKKIANIKINLKKISKLLILALNIYIQFISISLAQSVGSNGKNFVNYWVHSAHLMVDGEKMSKTKKNFFTLKDLKKKGFILFYFFYLLFFVFRID